MISHSELFSYIEGRNTFVTADNDDCITQWIQDSNVFIKNVDFTCPGDETIKLEAGLDYGLERLKRSKTPKSS